MKQKTNKLAQFKQWILSIVIKRFISYITMKRIKFYTANLGGSIWIYEDYYKQQWLSYTDFPRKRCKYPF